MYTVTHSANIRRYYDELVRAGLYDAKHRTARGQYFRFDGPVSEANILDAIKDYDSGGLEIPLTIRESSELVHNDGAILYRHDSTFEVAVYLYDSGIAAEWSGITTLV